MEVLKTLNSKDGFKKENTTEGIRLLNSDYTPKLKSPKHYMVLENKNRNMKENFKIDNIVHKYSIFSAKSDIEINI